MKKNNKGFTLIELLAIIVILAIIAVITIPILLNVIENSRKGAATNSAYGYKDAINKYYLTKLSENPNWNELDGTYTVGDLRDKISINGHEPINGSITIRNKIISGCLQYGDYKVTLTNGEVTKTEKNKCPLITIISQSKDDELSTGDEIAIDTEHFYVITSQENGNTVLFAKYNLYVGNYKDDTSWSIISENDKNFCLQNQNAKGWFGEGSDNSIPVIGTVYFSKINYWESKSGIEYPADVYDESMVGSYGSDNYSVARYVENYTSILKEKYKLSDITGRMLTYNEVTDILGCDESTGLCSDNSFVVSTNYWLGTAINAYVMRASNNGKISSLPPSFNEYVMGVRPVIEIPTSAIQLKSE